MAKNTFATLGFLIVLLLGLGLTSAVSSNGVTLTLDKTSLSNVTAGETYDFIVTVENENGTELYLDFETTGWTWNTTGETIADDEIKTFKGTLTIPSSGNKNAILNLYANSTSEKLFGISQLITLSYASNPPSETYCETDGFGQEKGHLEISSFEINNKGQGDDEEWEYLDEIEIEVTIENTWDENIDDVMVEIKFVDENGNTMSKKDMDLNDEEIDLGRIRDDDEEIAIFKIGELPIDLDEGDYKIYVRAYEEGNEDEECVSTSDDFTNSDETYFEFKISQSEDSTVIVKRDLTNVQASCGDENVEVRFMVYNVGDDDEDKVLVTLENSRLGIYEKYIIDNLRDGKGKEAVFYIDLPDEIEKSSQTLDIYTYYDYDDDENEMEESSYGESSEEEGDDFSIGLEVLSCAPKVPSIAAALDSATEIGKNLVVKTTIQNNGKLADFIVTPKGYESWADLVSVNPETVSIASGNKQEVTITLSPKEAGQQTFEISVISNGEIYNQPVSVKIAEEPGIFSGLELSDTVLYLIIGIVALLIIIFLVLIIRIARRPARKAEF